MAGHPEKSKGTGYSKKNDNGRQPLAARCPIEDFYLGWLLAWLHKGVKIAAF